MLLGRNESCHCESGKKYKKCCLVADNLKSRKLRSNEEITSFDNMMAKLSPVTVAEKRSPEYQALEDWVDVYLGRIEDDHPFRSYLEDGNLNHITLLELAKENDWLDYYETAEPLYSIWKAAYFK